MEENPDSSEFGTIKSISAVLQPFKNNETAYPDNFVEEINISVEIAAGNEGNYEERRNGSVDIIDEEPAGESGSREKAEEIGRHIASFLQLSPERVEVKILP